MYSTFSWGFRIYASSTADHNDLKENFDTRIKHHSPSASGIGPKKNNMGEHSREVPFVQRMVGTGALTRSLGTEKDVSHDTIDLVTATVWVKVFGKGITKLEMKCIEKYNKRNGMIFNLVYSAYLLNLSRN